MEEILASIRRIIEDNESGRKPAEAGEGHAETADPVRSVREDHPVRENAPVRENTVIEVESFRSELRTPSVEGRLERPEPRKPLTLAEVQAQIRAEQAGETARWPAELPSAEAPQAPAEPVSEKVEAIAETGPAAAAPQAETPAAPQPADTLESADPDTASLRPALVSENTGRKVAAAFGELSEAFAARSKKSFDDMAAEMLRPMLQDWLDNNLPTLVERLVREEIERVARGG